jgi:biopolymer transport protein ExbB
MTGSRSHPPRRRSPTAGRIVAALLLAGLALATTTSPLRADDEPVPLEANGSATETAEIPAAPKGSIGLDPVSLFTRMKWYALPFAIASVVAVWFVFERLVVLRRGRVIPRAFVDRFLDQLRNGRLDAARALAVCDENDSPVAHVFAHGIRKWGKPSVEVEQAIIDGGERQVAQLRRNLRVINGVATVTPLLGLLGTVIGMIEAFEQLAANSGALGKADQLAGGIALALLTTAAGLSIAIPALIAYMYLAGRVDELVMEMDHLAQNVVHLISAEGLASRPLPRKIRPDAPPMAEGEGEPPRKPTKVAKKPAV